MKNQINIDDKNTQQIGQNSDSQPTQIPEKPKKNYWMISTVLLLIVLAIVGAWFILNTKSKTSSNQKKTVSNQANQIVVTGVIRTSGLSEEEKQKLNLTSADFQITDFNKGQSGLEGYYLVTGGEGLPYKKDDFEKLLGKCLKVEGAIPPNDWVNNNSYNRAVLVPSKIEELDYSNCNPYLSTLPIFDNTQEKLSLRGTVVHGKRPAPDIDYDYQFQLAEPFIDKFSSAGSPQKVSLVDATPITNSIWSELENNINKEISVEGYMVWGYSESKYLQIISVKGTNNNSEEAKIKSLITKFEKYIQDRNVKGLMSLFTPAKTAEETASYHNLMGQDPDVGAPRLFNNVTSNFIVTNWKIARREYPDNKELITKDNNKYFVTVDETRKSWCNADPCAGTYSFENTSSYIFEIVNVNSQWMVDKYYLMNQGNTRNGGPKYEALMF